MRNPLRVASTTTESGLQPLAENLDIVAIDARIRALEDRLVQTRARRDRARRANLGVKPSKTQLERAELLAAGGAIPSAAPAAESEASDAEEKILRDGIGALHDQRAEIVSRLTYEASLLFQRRHVAALRKIDAAFGDIHNGLADLHDIVAQLHAAGFSPSCVVLPANIPALIYRLGNPNDSRGEAWRFRQWLIKTFGER
jgi:hypothetical protein